jgi:hypothetical protein
VRGVAASILVQLVTGSLRPFVHIEGVGFASPIVDFLRPLLQTQSESLAEKFSSQGGRDGVMNWVLFWGIPQMKHFALRTRYLDFFVATHPLMVICFIGVVRGRDAEGESPIACLTQQDSEREQSIMLEPIVSIRCLSSVASSVVPYWAMKRTQGDSHAAEALQRRPRHFRIERHPLQNDLTCIQNEACRCEDVT